MPCLGREDSIFLFCQEGSPWLVGAHYVNPTRLRLVVYPPSQPPES